jgi:hypothetical protein
VAAGNRTHHDDALYKQGLAAVNYAISLVPDQRLVVEDSELTIHNADELKAEFEAGLTSDWSDLDPRRLLERRK